MLKLSSLDMGSQDGIFRIKVVRIGGQPNQSGEGAWRIRKLNKGWYLLERGVQEKEV